jgi:hypothetical protein
MKENKINNKENIRKSLEESGIKYIPLEGTEFKLIDVNSINFSKHVKEYKSKSKPQSTSNGFHGIFALMYREYE